jgi:hypothetical protein
MRRWYDDIKMKPINERWTGVDMIRFAHDIDQWLSCVKMAVNIIGKKRDGSCATA